MTEEERRKRYSRDVELTPELEDWIMRAVNAQRAGWPVPEPPRTADSQGFAPAYVDPRSESLAQTPALVRPIAGMMDKLFRPGREGVANEMNREYMESLPTRQARQQKVASEGILEELRARAMRGDQLAIDKLSKFRTADKPSSSAANPLADFYRQQAGEQTDSAGNTIRRRGGDAPVTTSPTGEPTADTTGEPVENPYMNMTREAAINAFKNTSAAIDDIIARDTAIVDEGLRPRRGRWENLTGSEPVEANPKEVLEARSRLTDANTSKNKLLQQIKAAHNWSPAGSGSATEAGAAHIQ